MSKLVHFRALWQADVVSSCIISILTSINESIDRSVNITRCSAIVERPHCRVRYSFGQKWKTGTGRQYLRIL